MRHRQMWDEFQVGFWHPFGPYTGLTTQQVLDWKQEETVRHGWTFWSFAYSPTADVWLRLLSRETGPVFALCSHSPGAQDPDKNRGTLLATHHRELEEKEWHPMPDPDIMKVTNPFKRQGLALAFKVRRVVAFDPEAPPFSVEWYGKQENRWFSEKVPTRGEFLVRRGGSTPLRAVGALLELMPPYLAALTRNLGPVNVA